MRSGTGPSKRLYCVRYEPKTIAVTLDETGIDSFPTDGDQPMSSEADALQYGDNFFNGGFSCDSSKTGLCVRIATTVPLNCHARA